MEMLDVLYQRCVESGKTFKFDDGTIGSLDEETIKTFNEIRNFVKKKINPKHSKVLLELLNKYRFALASYFEKENEMFYKEGFADFANLLTICKSDT